MNNRQTMVNIFNKKVYDTFFDGELCLFSDITSKLSVKFTKYFDVNIDLESIVAFADTTLIRSGKKGMIFTLYGLYYSDVFEKTVYFNYKDMDKFTIKVAKNMDPLDAELTVESINNEKLIINLGDFDKYKLRELLKEIKLVSSKWIDKNYNEKPNGKVHKLNLTKGQLTKCKAIIHTASVASGAVGTGLAQIPLSDNTIIVPIQISMITSLGAVFGIRITEGVAKSLLGTLVTSFLGRGASQLFLGWVPGLGNAINTATATGITEAAGWIAVKHFFEIQQEDKGKYKKDAMKEGYVKASYEYEIKFKKQAERFMEQKLVYENKTNDFNTLLDDYEKMISELQKKLNRSEQENVNLHELINTYRRLKKLPKVNEWGDLV